MSSATTSTLTSRQRRREHDGMGTVTVWHKGGDALAVLRRVYDTSKKRRGRRTRKGRIQKAIPICVFPHQKGKAIIKRIALELGFISSFSLQILCVRSNSKESFFGCFRHCMHMGGCVACYKKPAIIGTADVPSNGLKNQGNAASKPSTSEDFWTTSTHDNMDNSSGQSQGSMSSTSATNQALVPPGSSFKTSNPNEFVNHALVLWNQTRQRWVGNKRSEDRTQQLREPRLSWNATYESLLGSNKPFRQPVPLAEMVDFLVDIWEQEGLYD